MRLFSEALAPDRGRVLRAASVKQWQLSWSGPLLMIIVRLPLLLLGLIVVWLGFRVAGQPQAWPQAVAHIRVIYSVCADLGCLLLLRWLLSREGLRLRDLIRFDRRRLGQDMLLGLGVFLLLAVVMQIASALGSIIAYGPGNIDLNAAWASWQSLAPPSWVLWFAVLIWPVTTGIMEEVTYRGYATPRLIALTGRALLGVLLPAFGFGLVHLTPPLAGWQEGLARFVCMFVVGVALELVYLRQRQLVPLIVAHWAIDAVFLGLLPLLTRAG